MVPPQTSGQAILRTQHPQAALATLTQPSRPSGTPQPHPPALAQRCAAQITVIGNGEPPAATALRHQTPHRGAHNGGCSAVPTVGVTYPPGTLESAAWLAGVGVGQGFWKLLCEAGRRRGVFQFPLPLLAWASPPASAPGRETAGPVAATGWGHLPAWEDPPPSDGAFSSCTLHEHTGVHTGTQTHMRSHACACGDGDTCPSNVEMLPR